MPDNISQDTTIPKRFRTFAQFFKNYMSLSSVATAALPIPITLSGFVPVFAEQRQFLSVWASLFCFLLLGLIFFWRNGLALYMFPNIVASSRQLSKEDATEAKERASLLAAAPVVLVFSAIRLIEGHHRKRPASQVAITQPLQAARIPQPRQDQALRFDGKKKLTRHSIDSDGSWWR